MFTLKKVQGHGNYLQMFGAFSHGGGNDLAPESRAWIVSQCFGVALRKNFYVDHLCKLWGQGLVIEVTCPMPSHLVLGGWRGPITKWSPLDKSVLLTDFLQFFHVSRIFYLVTNTFKKHKDFAQTLSFSDFLEKLGYLATMDLHFCEVTIIWGRGSAASFWQGCNSGFPQSPPLPIVFPPRGRRKCDHLSSCLSYCFAYTQPTSTGNLFAQPL